MSWGIRITILYLGFVALILTLAFTCFGQNVELESKDYYAKELKFQDQLDATNNVNSLTEPLRYRILKQTVQLNLPKEVLSEDFKGSVTFFRPSDSSKDRTITLAPDAEGKQLLYDAGFSKGVYKMQISFLSKGKNYYQENIINFQ